MKNLLFLVTVIAVFASCNNSPESKANDLIKEEMKKSLYHVDSYDPVETIVDSAFSPKDDPELIGLLTDAADLGREDESYESKAKRAKSSMAIWSGPYQSEYDRVRYNEEKQEYEEAYAKAEKIKEKGKKMYADICSKLSAQPKFIGFKAIHKYRAQNNAGQTVFGNTVFIIDDKFEKVLISYDEEDYKEIQEAFEQILEEFEDLDE